MWSRHKVEPSWMSFVAGALSASLVWSLGWAARQILISRESRLKLDRGGDDDNVIDDESDSNISVRWPWDKLRDSMIHVSASFLNFDPEDESDVSVSADDKTGPCIGEIFGMDVGGTLTKLVYFEQRIEEVKRLETHEGMHRKDRYHVAASALEVLQVRRSPSMTKMKHNSDSDNDLRGLWGLRQESVPDRLDEFASTCHIDESLPDERVAGTEIYHGDDRTKQAEESLGMGMKHSRSMINLSKSTEHAEVLDNFYSFASKLDTYETAVKDKHLAYYSRFLNGTFHFIRFETRRMNHAMNLIRYNDFHLNIKEIGATGGGAHKFANDWERELGIKMAKQDEMDSLVAGMQFVMADNVGEVDGSNGKGEGTKRIECYTFKPNNWTPQSDQKHQTAANGSSMENGSGSNESINEPQDSDTKSLHRADSSNSEANRPRIDRWWTSKKVQVDNMDAPDIYPYLLVSIGTGVSILRVDGPRKHERISGSTIGGGTYWGLCRLLTGSDSFSDVLDLAMKGDPSKVDMMVGDIYGKNSDALEKIGLPSDIVASSFGKLAAKQNPSEGIKEEDLARALLLMVTNNIGQVAHLNAKLYNISRIYFIGTFLQHNVISQQRLAYSIDYWSKGEKEAQFLEHEGYFGALGAFLLNQGIEHDNQQYKGNSNDVDPKLKKKRSMKRSFMSRACH
mmetsp:Transcript_14673/g.31307  ORF Transcript_14673/g.31307 Transcript_14673/m.31307 type:complete len:680 (+) Transcript_14673:157-2196(+)